MEATQKPKSSGYLFSFAHSFARCRPDLLDSKRASRFRSRSSWRFFSGVFSTSQAAEARSAAMTAVRSYVRNLLLKTVLGFLTYQ